jgi:hypothetical protein
MREVLNFSLEFFLISRSQKIKSNPVLILFPYFQCNIFRKSSSRNRNDNLNFKSFFLTINNDFLFYNFLCFLVLFVLWMPIIAQLHCQDQLPSSGQQFAFLTRFLSENILSNHYVYFLAIFVFASKLVISF